jgi:putative lipoprotein
VTMSRHIAAIVAAIPLAACAAGPAAAPAANVIEVTGDVFYLEHIALPPGTVLHVVALNDARMDEPAATLAEQEQPASNGPPFAFALHIPRNRVTSQTSVAVRAQLVSGTRLLFTSGARYAVTTAGVQEPLHIRVISIAP